ncbi:MAG: DUF4167 domain-containing protein [Pseudomonadota bacterium]
MRSSKSRSRNKNRNNNNRSMGNIINRVFDSSGPEGKVRGTPQQIIDKYNQLMRDAQLSGDRVNAENFQQHAEHYTRLLGEAQKEQDARREEQERQNRERQAERDRERAERQERESNGSDEQGGDQQGQGGGRRRDRSDPAEQDQPDVVEAAGGDSGLVETPENGNPAPKPKRTRSRKKASDGGGDQGGEAPQAAE